MVHQIILKTYVCSYTNRLLMANLQSFSGEEMSFESINQPTSKEFFISFRQTILTYPLVANFQFLVKFSDRPKMKLTTVHTTTIQASLTPLLSVMKSSSERPCPKVWYLLGVFLSRIWAWLQIIGLIREKRYFLEIYTKPLVSVGDNVVIYIF